MENQNTLGKEASAAKNIFENKWFKSGLILVALIAISAGVLYYQISSHRISIEKSQINAPSINLSPTTAGSLEEVFVKEGDTVNAYTPVARVGNEIIKTKVSGTIISVNNNIGKIFGGGETVVTMIDPTQLRVVGTIEEDKGLDKIQVGQSATFTVDAFGGRTYEGIVDEIASTSNTSSVAFSISDKREEKLFDVKVRFNPDQYPELKNGMSAKITIYK